MKKAVAAGAVILFAGAALLSASFRKEDIKVHRLDNGLKILLLEHHTIPNIALYTYYRVGSRNERPGLTGVSHFIEHMMFNGSPKVPPGEFDRRMEFAGGSNNASTSQDRTGYTDWIPAAALEEMLEMEADRMQDATFDPRSSSRSAKSSPPSGGWAWTTTTTPFSLKTSRRRPSWPIPTTGTSSAG